MLWIAQFTSNVGTWMQTVGAQWLMGDLSHSALKVALVQTAMSLPVFLLALGVLSLCRRQAPVSALGSEQVTAAMRAGTRYARSSPRLRAVLVRATLFVVFGAALWALLPVVARRELHLGSGGYGLLLGAVGVGAVLGAQILPALRRRFGTQGAVIEGTVLYAIACAVLAWVRVVPLVALALVGAGLGWIAVLSSLNATAQTVLPNWVRARGMAIYLLTFQGGQALGAFAWGLVTQRYDTRLALTVVSGG